MHIIKVMSEEEAKPEEPDSSLPVEPLDILVKPDPKPPDEVLKEERPPEESQPRTEIATKSPLSSIPKVQPVVQEEEHPPDESQERSDI